MGDITDITKCINTIEEDIRVKQCQIVALSNFETICKNGLTEDKYHEYCETDMRYTDVLGQSLLLILPFLEYEHKECNYFVYTYKGYEVRIPNNKCYGVDLIVPKYYKYKPEEDKCFALLKIEKEITMKEKYLQSKSLIEKSKVIFPYYTTRVAVICYLLKTRYKSYSKIYQNQLIYLQKEKEEMQVKNHEAFLSVLAGYERQENLIKEFSDLIFSWTEELRVYEKDMSVVQRRIKKEV